MSNPGCYGSVLFYDEEGRRCSRCPVKGDCQSEVETNKAALTTWFDSLKSSKSSTRSKRAAAVIEPIVNPSAKPVVSARVSHAAHTNAAGTAITTLNKKPREFVERWMDKGLDFEAYKRGVNPFETCGNKFASVAMRFLMDNSEGVTKLQLTDELIAKCGSRGQGWGMGTAASHAGIVIEAFAYLGIITTNGGKIQLR